MSTPHPYDHMPDNRTVTSPIHEEGDFLVNTHEDRRRTRIRRALCSLAGLSLAFQLIPGVRQAESDAAYAIGFNSGMTPSQLSAEHYPAVSADHIVLQDGANIRTDPTVAGPDSKDNVLAQLHEDKPVVIKIDPEAGKLLVTHNENGEWFGVPIEDLTNSGVQVDPKHDADGYAWVNEARASVPSSSDKPSSS